MYLKRIGIFIAVMIAFHVSYSQITSLAAHVGRSSSRDGSSLYLHNAAGDDSRNYSDLNLFSSLVLNQERSGFDRGFGHYTEIGALAATKNRPDNVTTAAFTFQTVNGYRFSRWFFTGIGVAADLYATQTNVPVFASVRGDFIKDGRFVPFYFVDGGYGIDITSSTTDISYKGGVMFAGGIGFKIPVNNGTGFMVSFGYRMQKGSTIQSGLKQEYTNNRIALRAGFYL